MMPLLFTLALLAAPPEPALTVSQLYDGCVRYVQQGSTSGGHGDIGQVICAAEVAIVEAGAAAEAAMAGVDGSQPRPPRRFCLPESLLSAERDTGAPLAQAFIAYVDRNPASRDMDYDEVFQRSLAEKWPCSR